MSLTGYCALDYHRHHWRQQHLVNSIASKIDWDILTRAKEILTDCQNCVNDFTTIEDGFKSEFKRFRQNSTNLQAKYESSAHWTKMNNEANTRLKDELLRGQKAVQESIVMLVEVIDS